MLSQLLSVSIRSKTPLFKPLLPGFRLLSRSIHSKTLDAPQRPLNELYYHLLRTPESLVRRVGTGSVFAVSFLPKPPTVGLENAKTVLGVIPAFQGNQEAGLNDFIPNPLFLNLMHEAIKQALKDEADEAISAEAVQRQSGWLHIQDERNVPALGRIGSPDDIIASVMVEEGKILPDTYQVMPSYRIFTADGPPTLSAGLAQRLEGALRQQLEREVDE